jgi:hypothetical protein
MAHYIGLIHKDAESHFCLSFPDFPGVAFDVVGWVELFAKPSNSAADRIESRDAALPLPLFAGEGVRG